MEGIGCLTPALELVERSMCSMFQVFAHPLVTTRFKTQHGSTMLYASQEA